MPPDTMQIAYMTPPKQATSFSYSLLYRHDILKFIALFYYTVLSPFIITHPTDTSAAAPFSGVFTCSARSVGYINVVWHRENSPLPEKCTASQVSLPQITTSTLVVPNVTAGDNGKYFCVVWANGVGTRSKSVTLYISSMFCDSVDTIYMMKL